MTTTMGACDRCMAMNSRTAVTCIECKARLPWADEAERQKAAQAQAVQKAQQAANLQKIAQPAKVRPAKEATLDDDDIEWFLLVGGGILILALTAFSFWRLSVWETTGGFYRMRGITALLYSMGGKWMVSGVGSLLGVLVIAGGILKYFQERE